MLSRLKSSSLGSVLSFTCFRYSPVFPTKFLLSFHRSHRPSLLRLDSKQTPCSPVYIMSYRGYARYPPDPTSRPPHAGLELLLGAAEHLESASQLPEQDTRLSSLRHTTSARRSIDGVSSKSPRDGHPFTRSPETSRFMQCSDSYDPSESDKVHSSASMPFRTRTRRQRQSEQNKSSSWPGTSSSSSTADLDLFIPAQCSPSSPTSELPALDSTLEDRLEQRNKLNPSSSSSSSTTTTRPPFKRAQTAVSCIRCRNVSSFRIYIGRALCARSSLFSPHTRATTLSECGRAADTSQR